MFARFRNLFSKNKNESETEVKSDASLENSFKHAEESANSLDSNEEFSKSECINRNESQLNSSVESETVPSNSLTNEVTELLQERLSKNEEFPSTTEKIINNKTLQDSKKITDLDMESEKIFANKDISKEHGEYKQSSIESNDDHNEMSIKSTKDFSHDQKPSSEKIIQKQTNRETEIDCREDTKQLKNVKNDISPFDTENENEKNSKSIDRSGKDEREILIIQTIDRENFNQLNKSNKDFLNENVAFSEKIKATDLNKVNEINITKNTETFNLPLQIESLSELNSAPITETELESTTALPKSQDSQTESTNNMYPSNDESNVRSPELSESSKSLLQSSVKENSSHSTTQSFLQDLNTNLCKNSSIVIEDLPSEIATPSPTVESTISGSSSNTNTLDSSSTSLTEVSDPSKIIVNPIDNNGLACNAISNKLSDIAEVAESLDAVIRDVQENVQSVEVDSNPSPSHKKLNTLRSASSEDWHSRSTEDDSFATASEGNFTPSSSSFQTASGRTSSYISCDKNSFEASEADDSTYAFEMPELTSPLNMSFEGSERSYLSAQPSDKGDLNQGQSQPQNKQKMPKRLMKNHDLEQDQSSVADIEELHSESVTPTPGEYYDDYHVDSVAIESETELEIAGIADAPSMEILTEHTTLPMSRTPEVSPSTSNNCSNQNAITAQMTVSMAADSNDQQGQQHSATTTNNNNIHNKPNAAWRRSKYYENITKQTIKGFL